ncbi:S8 family peptidase [Pseudoxanthomonas winnipegensis]|uniref:S8 family peptidase n=1 Tax=Pseudoxanthomonas winnipegensis TaxID=2480810 RepID=UPI001F1DEA6C|nr:S8 family peptidase [Pseudoxanthomonas winnipegensis]
MNKQTRISRAIIAALCASGAVFGADAATSGKPQIVPISKPASAPIAASRLIVKYRSGNDGGGATVRAAAARAGVAQGSTNARAAAAPLDARPLRHLANGAQVMRVSRPLQDAELTKVLTELRADPSVEYAEADTMLRPVRDMVASHTLSAATSDADPTPNDPYFANYQWHLKDGPGGIHAPQAWQRSTGAGVVVAVLDTGILLDHPDMKNGNHLLQGYDFISDKTVSRRPTDARVPGALDYGDWVENGNECGLSAEGSSWHGTHVSGTIAELTNNGIGAAGVAYDAQILPVRVLGRCGGYVSDIADAIVWASGGHVDGVPDNTNPAEVINLSLGGSGGCQASTQAAIDGAVARGSVVVVAAGNNAANAANYSPASCNNVITVGAAGIAGDKAYYSNYGTKVDLAGPGGGADHDTGNDGWDGYVVQASSSSATSPDAGQYNYKGLAGTSMASPHVAATAALVQSALVANGRTPLAAADMKSLLKRTSTPFAVTPPSSQPIGTGIVNARLALDKALEVPCAPNATDCVPVSLPLANAVARTGTSSRDSEETLYAFQAVAGKVLSVITYSGNGSVKMYVKYGAEPTATSYDAKSDRVGTSQTVRISAPTAGTYYIKLVGGSGGFSGVSVLGRQ